MRDGPGLLYFDFVIDPSTDSTNIKKVTLREGLAATAASMVPR